MPQAKNRQKAGNCFLSVRGMVVVAEGIIQVRTSPNGTFSDQASLIAVKAADGSVLKILSTLLRAV